MKKFAMLMVSILLLFGQFENEYTEALALERSKEDAKALIIYDRILSIDSNQVRALTHGANLSTQLGFKAQDENVRLTYYYKGIDYAKKAISISPEYDQAYISYARALGRLALISGTKTQLKMSKTIKQSVDKAVELNPENDIAWHILGKWYFRFADLSWFERSIAGIVYGDVPSATFEEAKSAFQKAMEMKPNMISHQFEYAKTCVELDQINEAKSILMQIKDAPIRLSTDAVYKRQAAELLSDID